MKRLFEESFDRMSNDRCVVAKSEAFILTVEIQVNLKKIIQMMEDAVNQLTDQLDVRVAQVTKDFLIGILKIIKDEHNMDFVQESLRKATQFKQPSFLNAKDHKTDSKLLSSKRRPADLWFWRLPSST